MIETSEQADESATGVPDEVSIAVVPDPELEGDPTAPHVRLLPAMAGVDDRRAAVPALPSVGYEQRSPARPVRRLADLGLPAHLTPPDGGLFPLIALLEAVPAPKIPSLRSGDSVVVVTLDVPGCDDDASPQVAEELELAGHPPADDQLQVLTWPTPDDPRRARRAVEDLLAEISAVNPRLTLLRTTPDASATSAYTACRAIPAVQLDLHHVQVSRHPAAALAWGAPIAFLDGRVSSPTLIAAVLVDHLSGGTA